MRRKNLFIALGLFPLFSCQTRHHGIRTDKRQTSAETFPDALDKVIDLNESMSLSGVFLAQTHVLDPDDPLFRLVSDRDALLLIKLQAKGSSVPAPRVSVEMYSGEQQTQLELKGPNVLSPFRESPRFSLSDDFTVTIPRAWVKPGMTLRLHVGEYTRDLQPRVGAPNPLHLTLLRYHLFGLGKEETLPPEWEGEFEAKLPIASLQVARIKPWIFPELVIPPRPDVGLRAFRVSSQADYKSKALAYLTRKAQDKGQALDAVSLQQKANFDGEQGFALDLTNAVQEAAGQSRLSVYYAFTSVISANGGIGVGGGLADAFSAMGPAGNLGVLWHEFGHTLSLPHWANTPQYPYQNASEGISIGHSWGYDPRVATLSSGLPLPYLIPPTVQANSVQANPSVGSPKRDPMAGGGSGDQEKGFQFRMFSDYSEHQMQLYLERELILWDSNQKAYLSWDPQVSAYKALTEARGTLLPKLRDENVWTLLYSIHTRAQDDEANFVYPPLGPYSSSLIRTFDPQLPEDRKASQISYCKPRCDYSLRVTQGGRIATYIVRGLWNPDAIETDRASHFVGALNLSASVGPLQRIELLWTPQVSEVGLPNQETVLFDRRVSL